MTAVVAIIEAIDVEIEARLNSISGASVDVEASGDPTTFPALNLKDARLVPDEDTEPGTTRYDYFVTVEGNVESGGGHSARADRNALYSMMIAAMLIDDDLAGLVEQFEERETRFGVAMLASKRRLSFVTEFQLRFPADRGAPTLSV